MNLSKALLWPYLPTLGRLTLALALGLFVGLERQHRGKEAGLRTFGFAALLGALGGLLGDSYALFSLATVLVLAVLLNVQTLRAEQGTELTTSVALVVTALAGVLCGMGHTVTPAAVAVATAALLIWKERMAGFSEALTDTELRSAILLAILAFVIYPALPEGSLDRWSLFEPRAAWLTVLLIAGIGFVNYILLKLYGERGIELTGFLGGLVNSTVTVTELANRHRESNGRLEETTYRGVVLATTAMILRNVVLLGLLASSALFASLPAVLPMTLCGAGLVLLRRPTQSNESGAPVLSLESPFSITSALKYGLLFLALQAGGTLAQRALGHVGFYAVSLVGGIVSSASAVASAATLCAQGKVPGHVAAAGAVLATLASTLMNLVLIARVSADRRLTRRLAWPLGAITLFGLLGAALQAAFTSVFSAG